MIEVLDSNAKERVFGSLRSKLLRWILGAYEKPLREASKEIAAGLLPMIDSMPSDYPYEPDESPEHLRWMVSQILADNDMTVDKISRWIGCIHGILKVHKCIDFSKERDRTRPLVHNAYKRMGIIPPQRRERKAA